MSRLFGKGNNYWRQLGVGNKSREADWREIYLDRTANIKKIECYGSVSACITDDGDAYRWGYHWDSFSMVKMMRFYYKVPIIMTLAKQSKLITKWVMLDRYDKTPKLIGKLAGVHYVDFRLGSGFMLLRDHKGRLHGLGDNNKGQCGLDTSQIGISEEPKLIEFKGEPDMFVSQFDAGMQFSIVLTSSLRLNREETTLRVR